MNGTPQHRTGSSLIEIIVLLSVSSTLFVIAIGWIHQSFRLASIMRDHERHHQSLLRLSRQFRDDAHLATQVTSEGDTMIFQADEFEIQYRRDGNTVRRSLRNSSDDAASGEESYQLSEHTAVRFDIDETPDWVALTVHRVDPASRSNAESGEETETEIDDSPRDVAIRAAVGRWRGDRDEPLAPESTDSLESEEAQP
ncbi:hypothetical protein [Aporhodopirellula aestuarii]|uniref:Uncharacterized protein n=1 Tax=Aporhodopirellula aestuarii TaxID=2950107 RepID=A0ABT0U3Q3_9BACT|nr:hypothetical protein [Aporhodopirellula aestuarii]MCM2371536.1 hypothetical protein [Aporhodopirellula aestuarii]